MAFKIEIDVDKCIGSGVCALIAPQVFDLDDDGTVVLLRDHADTEEQGVVQEAAAACPAWVIRTTGE